MHKHYYKNYYDKLSDAKDYLRAMVNREKGLKKLLRRQKNKIPPIDKKYLSILK